MNRVKILGPSYVSIIPVFLGIPPDFTLTWSEVSPLSYQVLSLSWMVSTCTCHPFFSSILMAVFMVIGVKLEFGGDSKR